MRIPISTQLLMTSYDLPDYFNDQNEKTVCCIFRGV